MSTVSRTPATDKGPSGYYRQTTYVIMPIKTMKSNFHCLNRSSSIRVLKVTILPFTTLHEHLILPREHLHPDLITNHLRSL